MHLPTTAGKTQYMNVSPGEGWVGVGAVFDQSISIGKPLRVCYFLYIKIIKMTTACCFIKDKNRDINNKIAKRKAT